MKLVKAVPAFIVIPFTLLLSFNSSAATISVTLGNDTGLIDGTQTALIPTI
ncbi:hypothetical protein GTH32_18645 [Alteromonas sp. 345S023]|uniref:Uncharacterized protein n=1 Tax=Alteromonas profundi TaxID=2696062 RepID=A0A7X5LPP9_9ALTE|nr:hypothetical protein [Alteromonas profundi]NDV93193.1 hypothetical protein [Alteromonas profundi]